MFGLFVFLSIHFSRFSLFLSKYDKKSDKELQSAANGPFRSTSTVFQCESSSRLENHFLSTQTVIKKIFYFAKIFLEILSCSLICIDQSVRLSTFLSFQLFLYLFASLPYYSHFCLWVVSITCCLLLKVVEIPIVLCHS